MLSLYRTFVPYLRRYLKWFAIAYGALVGMVLVKLVQPWPIKLILDYILLQKPMPKALASVSSMLGNDAMWLLAALCIAIVLVVFLEGMLAFANKYYLSAAGHTLTNDIRRSVFAHLQSLPTAFHKSERSGDLVVRLTSDINAMKKLLIAHLDDLASFFLSFAAMTATMLWMDWQLTLIALCIVPFLYLFSSRFSKKVGSVAERKRSKESEVAAIVQETVTSMPVVKAFTQEEQETMRFAKESDASLQADLRKSKLGGLYRRSVFLLMATGTALVVWYGARRVLAQQLTPGDLIVFLSYVKDLYKPIGGLSDLIVEFSTSLVSGKRIADLINREPVTDAPDAIDAPPLEGEVAFEDVTFGYVQGEPVLQGLSFHVKPGQVVALVGSSGTGKTTIVNLLLRFYDPWSGRILIDGQDLHRFKVKSLRDQMSVVLQESVLFRRTIRENIAYGKPDAFFEEIMAAARAAHAHEFIMELPHGYDTVLDERGENLSGGQRQRIALARAFMRNGSILIFDEPVTGLDAITEREVHDTLVRLLEGRTAFVIAHSLSFIKFAHLILMVEEGKVVAQGTHGELLERSPAYRELCTLQHKA